MLVFPDVLYLLFFALLLDGMIGDPNFLWRRLPHPVVLIGGSIGFLERHLNGSDKTALTRRLGGVLALVLLVIAGFASGYALQAGAAAIPVGIPVFSDQSLGNLVTILIAAIFIAQKSLYQHVAAVRDGLARGGLAGGRKSVAMIVGRDPEQLDEAGVSRAAIESCAENFSDGVVAPVFWFALLGLPGLIAYKAVNTADSMIGHKSDAYIDFGWASARFDDLVNLPASRLSGLLIALAAPLAGGSPRKAFKVISADAGKHRSPNAGWPEAAMAGALDIALAGPRIYPGYSVNDPYMNEAGARNPTATDIERSLNIMAGACALMGLTVLILALLF